MGIYIYGGEMSRQDFPKKGNCLPSVSCLGTVQGLIALTGRQGSLCMQDDEWELADTQQFFCEAICVFEGHRQAGMGPKLGYLFLFHEGLKKHSFFQNDPIFGPFMEAVK